MPAAGRRLGVTAGRARRAEICADCTEAFALGGGQYEGGASADWTPQTPGASMRPLIRATPMLRVAALLSVSIAMQCAAMAEEPPKQDTVQVHGKSLVLSCAEWKRNADGSWSSIGPLLVGTSTVNDVILRGAKETKVLEEKCGNGPPAALPPKGDSTRHMRHMHGPAGPAQGT